MNPPLAAYLLTAGLLFCAGFFGVLFRRNALVLFMCLELMLNASNLALLAFARYHATPERPLLDAPVLVFFIITVAAAEVAVGLAIIVQYFRLRQTVMVNEMTELRG